MYLYYYTYLVNIFKGISNRILRVIDSFLFDFQRSKELTKSIKDLLKNENFENLERLDLAFVTSDYFFYKIKSAVKLCIVNGKQTMIYRRGFESSNLPQFNDLKRLASIADWQLLEDRRQAPSRVAYDRRRNVYLLSVKLITSGLIFHNTSVMANEFKMPSGFVLLSDESPHEQTDYKNNKNSIAYDLTLKVLEKKWRKSKKDPIYLKEDIKHMALYIAGLPEAYKLIMSIKDEPWTLNYRANDFRSEVKGTRFSVRSVDVFFDSRSAASLVSEADCHGDTRSCIASPVDSLIHELLHVKLALTKSEEFISDGGMNGFVYPHRHERKVIALERKIYKSMTLTDNKPRPIRSNHVGYLVQANCVTCSGVSI